MEIAASMDVLAQLPSEAQVPVLPQGRFAGQRPCGSFAPSVTLAHEPDEHVWQVPQADMLQQKPSTH